jgi:hypothetical protein
MNQRSLVSRKEHLRHQTVLSKVLLILPEVVIESQLHESDVVQIEVKVYRPGVTQHFTRSNLGATFQVREPEAFYPSCQLIQHAPPKP